MELNVYKISVYTHSQLALKPSKFIIISEKDKTIPMTQIEQNITKIMKNQQCKKFIESKLSKKRIKTGKQAKNSDRVQIDSMLFQVVKENCLADHIFFFPCVFQLTQQSKGEGQERRSSEAPKAGSFIRTIKMDFDLINYNLIVYDYQYLGGQGSIVPSNGAKTNWNSQTISQVIRKNNTVRGGQILIDSYLNEKGAKQSFQIPRVQFLTVKLLERLLCDKRQAVQLNTQKRFAPKQCDQSPKQCDQSPKQCDQSHKQCDYMHKQCDQSHKQCDQSHKQCDQMHKQCDQTPKQCNQAHKQCDQALLNTQNNPQRIKQQQF